MGQYTPGPWDNSKRVVICNQDDAGIQISYLRTSDPNRRAEGRANAFLIAAAPDLLEALSEFLELYESDEGCIELPQYCAAAAAIAKARGDQ
jgi:hypothetical protein